MSKSNDGSSRNTTARVSPTMVAAMKYCRGLEWHVATRPKTSNSLRSSSQLNLMICDDMSGADAHALEFVRTFCTFSPEFGRTPTTTTTRFFHFFNTTMMIIPDKRTFIASVFASIALIASRHDFVLAFSNAKTARHRPTYTHVSSSLETPRALLTQRSDDINGSIGDISNAITTDRRDVLKSALVAATALVAADRPAHAVQRAVCDPDVFVLRKGNRVVNIIGTVHISSVSADLSQQLIRETKPGAVFVELDVKRLTRAYRKQHQRPKPGLDVGYVDEEGNLKITALAEALEDTPEDPGAVTNKVVSDAQNQNVDGLQYQNFDSLGLRAAVGVEFLKAMEQGLEEGATIVLGDRDVDVTIKRQKEALLSTGRKRLREAQKKMDAVIVDEMIRKGAIITPEKKAEYDAKGGMTKEDYLNDYIEKMKGRDTTELEMKTMKEYMPELYDALVGERDSYMASNIDKLAQFKSIVAVMGDGHLAGVSDNLIQLGWSITSKPCGAS